MGKNTVKEYIKHNISIGRRSNRQDTFIFHSKCCRPPLTRTGIACNGSQMTKKKKNKKIK